MRNDRFFALMLVLLIALSGSAVAAPATVQYVVHGAQNLIDTYREIFADFTAQTGIPVEVVPTTGGQKGKWEKVLTLVAGGVSPDVVGGVSTEFGEFAISGLLRPLDDLIRASRVRMDALVPPFVDALQLGGKQYLLPYGSSALAMFYNVRLLDTAGLAYPPREWNTREWDYPTFVEYAKKLTITAPDGSINQYGIAGIFWDSWITLPYPWGGRWVSDDLRTFEGTRPDTVASVQALQDLIYEHRVMFNGTGQTNFVSHKGGMAGLGTWSLAALAQSDVDWDFMPWFRVKDRAQAAIFPIGYGILSTSDKLEESWELVRWLTWNEKANLEYATAAGAIPSLRSNLPAWRNHWRSVVGRPVSADVVIEQAGLYFGIVQIRKSPAFWTINDIMGAAVRQVTANNKSAQAALEEVAPQIQSLLEETAPRFD
ncbi:MAG: extracellular solute-binding protein [Firmicutes bacterium]|nr:extracellular solute-binding protein [Bacillota bacterium]